MVRLTVPVSPIAALNREMVSHVSRVTCYVSPPEHEVEDEVEHPDVVLLHDLQHAPHVIRQVRVGPDSFCNKY